MMGFNVTSQLNLSAADVKKVIGLAQYILDNQIIKDSNFYAPEDQGTLHNSGITASSVGEGRVVWNTPYSRRLYYNPQYNFSKDKNPNAQGLWFEAAKSAHKKEWLHIVKEAVKQNL